MTNHRPRLDHTSGSTGRPKRMRIDDALESRRGTRMGDRWQGHGLDSVKVLATGMNPAEATGRKYVAWAKRRNVKLVPLRGRLNEIVAIILKERPDGLIGRPGFLWALVKELVGRHKFTYICAIGSRLPPEAAYALGQACERNLWSLYGATEVGTIALGDYQMLVSGQTGKILDDVQAKVLETGEIAVKTPTMVARYEGRYDKRAALVDGWFHTGDLGIIDDEGAIRLTGRLKPIVKMGKENAVG